MKVCSLFRPFLTVLVLVVFLATMVGIFDSYFTFLNRQHFQAQVKKQKSEVLKKLVFSENEYRKIKWEDQNREFEFNGKMYDVASIEISNGQYIVICENDLIEDLLLGFLKSDSKSKSKSPQLQLCLPESLFESNSAPQFELRGNTFYLVRILSISCDKNFLPPRVS